MGPVEHTEFRGGAGVAQYLAEDQPHLGFPTKEAPRDARAPNQHSVRRVKRIGRFVKGAPRLLMEFPWQGRPDTLKLWTFVGNFRQSHPDWVFFRFL